MGVVIVGLWLVMIALLMKKHHFEGQKEWVDSAQAVRTIDSPQREWKEIYLKDKKVGYSVNLIKPVAGGYFIQEEIFLRLNLLGMASGVYTATQCRVDDQFFLKSFNFNMTSGVVAFNLSGKVEADELVLVSKKGKGRRTERIRLSRPPMIAASLPHVLKSRNMRVGQTFTLPIFDPSTMAQKEALVKVVGRGPVKINRISYDAFRLETELWGSRMTFWVDEQGATLKEEGFMGLTIVKSSPARAPRDLEVQEEIDIYEAASIGVDRKLPNPTRLRYLKLQVEGIDHAALDPEVLSGGRQRFHQGIMEIAREDLPVRVSSDAFPYGDQEGALKAFLRPEFNIESDDALIIEKAREISGRSKDPLVVAKRLFTWVYHNVEKKPVVSVPSALETLRTRVGDCNEHTTLLTALLRASKIPARIIIGIVYTRDKFYYHAWTEAYLGEWITMDPTLNQMPVDATHIKLMEGNLDRQVEIAGLMGRLRLKVMDYSHD